MDKWGLRQINFVLLTFAYPLSDDITVSKDCLCNWGDKIHWDGRQTHISQILRYILEQFKNNPRRIAGYQYLSTETKDTIIGHIMSKTPERQNIMDVSSMTVEPERKYDFPDWGRQEQNSVCERNLLIQRRTQMNPDQKVIQMKKHHQKTLCMNLVATKLLQL